MTEFGLIIRQVGCWTEIAARCGGLAAVIGHRHRTIPPDQVAAAVAVMLQHAGHCAKCKSGDIVARLEAGRLRPIPPIPTRGTA